MPAQTYFESGTHNRMCDYCAKDMKRNQLRRNWENLLVCEECWDTDPNKLFNSPIRTRGTIPAKDVNKDDLPAYNAADHDIDESKIQ